jgi:hypothetical protein
MQQETLECSTCNQIKSKRAFHLDKSKKRDYDYDCRKCVKLFRNQKKFPHACAICRIHKQLYLGPICKKCSKFIKCSVCNQIKERKNFYKQRNECKECFNEKSNCRNTNKIV